jgi:hypothetical protein
LARQGYPKKAPEERFGVAGTSSLPCTFSCWRSQGVDARSSGAKTRFALLPGHDELEARRPKNRKGRSL